MALAVVRPWRKEAATVKVHVKAQFAEGGFQLRIELIFIVVVDEAIELCEVALDVLVNGLKRFGRYSPVGLEYEPRRGRPVFRSLRCQRRVAIALKLFLADAEKVPSRVQLVWLRQRQDSSCQAGDDVHNHRRHLVHGCQSFRRCTNWKKGSEALDVAHETLTVVTKVGAINSRL